MRSRPVKPRATRMADIVASVPELTSLTISTDGTASQIASASSISASVGAPKRVPVAQQQRAPGAYVIDVLVAIHIEDAAPLSALHKHGLAADALEGAHRGI